jgi:hypothetical protein
MDIAALSMIMSQSKSQTAVSIAVMKKAMDTGKENATQMTEMIKILQAQSFFLPFFLPFAM